MRIGTVGVCDFVDVEEHRAGNVRRLILVLRIALGGRQIPRGIDDAHIGCV